MDTIQSFAGSYQCIPLCLKFQGGYIDCINGMWRLQGTLAVTRGFGDKNLKRWVSSKPDVTKIKITPECEFVILASDGLWDKVITTHNHTDI